jgi:hypothetical protein
MLHYFLKTSSHTNLTIDMVGAWPNMREHSFVWNYICNFVGHACPLAYPFNSIFIWDEPENEWNLESGQFSVHSMLHRRVSSRWFRLALKAFWPHKRLSCRDSTHDAWKTRCSPRTRMQSRRTLLWNKLFEQSCTCFPCYRTSALYLWNAEEDGVQSVECGVYRVEW